MSNEKDQNLRGKAADIFANLKKNYYGFVGKGKDTVQGLKLDRKAKSIERKQEKQWSEKRANALVGLGHAIDAIEIQRANNQVVHSLTESLLKEMEILERFVKETTPEDVVDYCDELLEKFNDVPQSEDGDIDEKKRDNQKIDRIYKRGRQEVEEIRKLMFNNIEDRDA